VIDWYWNPTIGDLNDTMLFYVTQLIQYHETETYNTDHKLLRLFSYFFWVWCLAITAQ